MVLRELPGFPHVPELPSRGPWFDMVGRGCAVLLDLPAAHSAGRWSFVRGVGIGTDLRKARSGLRDDTEQFADLVNRRHVLGAHADEDLMAGVKLQFCGPVTLAASVELPNGQAALSDGRARADIAASLAEGLRQHIMDVAGWFPDGLPLVVQVDEPAITGALQGIVPTVSGMGHHAALATDEVEAQLANVVQSVAGTSHEVVLHCCAEDPPVRVLAAAGAHALSVDLTLLELASEAADHLGEWLQGGNKLFGGVSVSDPSASVDDMRSSEDSFDPGQVSGVRQLADLGRLMGEEWLRAQAVQQLTLTPPCGLADTTIDQAAPQYRRLRTLQRDFVSGNLP